MEKEDNMKQTTKTKKVLVMLVCVVTALAVVVAIYLGNYYHATDRAEKALESSANVTVSRLDKQAIVYTPKQEAKAGFLFYPGGKVQYEAYAPLMQGIAEKGILCILVHMPCNMAVFNRNAANGLQTKFPAVQKWYIGGHSLGGAMAASYVAKHMKEYEGLVLCAAYSTVDLQKSGLKVISIYGSHDKVLNHKKYVECYENLPNDFTEKIIDGGCHAYFGSYGKQAGDGEASITEEEQQEIAANFIAKSILDR